MRRPIALLVLGLSLGLLAAEPDEFVLIENPGRPDVALQREQVSRIFLRKEPCWPDGGEAMPVDQAEERPVREHFTSAIHRRHLSAILSYWQQQVFSGRGSPPPILEKDQDVVDYVARTPGALGYVSKAARLAGVKVMRVTE